jgi:hypothetical protein
MFVGKDETGVAAAISCRPTLLLLVLLLVLLLLLLLPGTR